MWKGIRLIVRDFFGGFFAIQFSRLKGRCTVFHIAPLFNKRAPGVENIFLPSPVFGIKVPYALVRFGGEFVASHVGYFNVLKRYNPAAACARLLCSIALSCSCMMASLTRAGLGRFFIIKSSSAPAVSTCKSPKFRIVSMGPC